MTVRATEDGTVRDDPPVPTDFALVVRPLGGFGSGNSDLVAGAEFPISAVAVQLMAANAITPGVAGSRTTAVIQNTGTANIRVGGPGVTATAGLRLPPNAVVIFDEIDVYNKEIWAISEGVDSIAFAQESILQ